MKFTSQLNRRSRRGTTLTEVLIAVPISAAFGILTVTVLAVSAVLFKNITDETAFRQRSMNAMNMIERDLRMCESSRIATDYLTSPTTTTYNGNCIYMVNLTRPVGEQNIAYYYYKKNGWNWGNIYLDTDTSTPPDPDDDRIVARRMTAFELRRNPMGVGAEYRVALRGDTREQKFMGYTSGQGNKMIVSTTIRPRHN